MPTVSVLIPTKDRRALVRRTVDIAREQRGVDVEVVVTDDGSSDGTSEALAGLDGVRVVRHEVNRGLARARNSAIGAARGEWLAFLDDDDRWAPDKLQRQIDTAVEAGRRWAYGTALVVDAEGAVLRIDEAPSAERLRRDLHYCNPVPAGASNVVVHRSLLEQAGGGFDPDLRHFADWDLWSRLELHGPPAVLDDPLVGYVSHGANMSIAEITTAQAEFLMLAEKFERLRGERMTDLGIRYWIAEGYARAGRHRLAARVLFETGLARRSRAHLVRGAAELARGARLLPAQRASGRGAPTPPWARAA